MSLTMQKISAELLDQYNTLPSYDYLSINNFNMEIENVDVKITVFMTRTGMLDKPKDELSIHFELPEDKQERKIVRAHIRSQLHTKILESKPFDPVSITFLKGSQEHRRRMEADRKKWEAGQK